MDFYLYKQQRFIPKGEKLTKVVIVHKEVIIPQL